MNAKTDTAQPRRRAVRVKVLSERARSRLRAHFLALDSNDRLLRFGSVLPDDLVIRYVESLDFSRDRVFGVYSGRLRLIGVGHLAFAPREASPVLHNATLKEHIAEFGVSVLPEARGLGVGSKLFRRAAIHCRNEDVDTLYMHCLASNRTMIHIASKAGMKIHRDYGEADAYLRLAPASPRTMLAEAVEEQFALLDYGFRANVRAALKWLRRLPGMRRG